MNYQRTVTKGKQNKKKILSDQVYTEITHKTQSAHFSWRKRKTCLIGLTVRRVRQKPIAGDPADVADGQSWLWSLFHCLASHPIGGSAEVEPAHRLKRVIYRPGEGASTQKITTGRHWHSHHSAFSDNMWEPPFDPPRGGSHHLLLCLSPTPSMEATNLPVHLPDTMKNKNQPRLRIQWLPTAHCGGMGNPLCLGHNPANPTGQIILTVNRLGYALPMISKQCIVPIVWYEIFFKAWRIPRGHKHNRHIKRSHHACIVLMFSLKYKT